MGDPYPDFQDLSYEDQNNAVISAMRLASFGAADDTAALTILRMLLEVAPPTNGGEIYGPRLLTDMLRNGNVSVNV